MKFMNFLRTIFFEGYWECKYRKVSIEQRLPEASGKWTGKLKVSRRYWCADPFLVEEDDIIYAFVEMMDRYHSRGLIGYAEITDPNADADVKVLADLGCHASYPNVFKYADTWYMIPETSERNSIELYKAIHFPDQWEKIAVLEKDIKAVDSTVFWQNDKLYLFLYQSFGEKNDLSIVELFPNEKRIKHLGICLEYNERIGRPGGGILNIDGEYIRPTQYGVHHYGEKLVFKKFTIDLEGKKYYEHDCLEMRCENFSDCKNFIGLHTYSQCGTMEIIDIYKKKFNALRPLQLVCKRMNILGYR